MQYWVSMLLSIGRRRAQEGLVDLLQECHLRIRTFLRSAERLAAGDRVNHEAAAAVATDIHRYFSGAFPLHLADEDETIAPRLREARAETRAALTTMSDDHVVQAPCIHDLVAVCDDISAGGWSDRTAARLASATTALAGPLEAHLELEERVIFPAIAALPAEVQAEIVLEMRARREQAWR